MFQNFRMFWICAIFMQGIENNRTFYIFNIDLLRYFDKGQI